MGFIRCFFSRRRLWFAFRPRWVLGLAAHEITAFKISSSDVKGPAGMEHMSTPFIYPSRVPHAMSATLLQMQQMAWVLLLQPLLLWEFVACEREESLVGFASLTTWEESKQTAAQTFA